MRSVSAVRLPGLAVRLAVARRQRRQRDGLGELALALVVGELQQRDPLVGAGRGDLRAAS